MVRLTSPKTGWQTVMPNEAAKSFIYNLVTNYPWMTGDITEIEEIEDGEIVFVVFANKTLLKTTDKQLPKDVKRRKGYKVFTSYWKALEHINEKNRICFDDIRHKTYRI